MSPPASPPFVAPGDGTANAPRGAAASAAPLGSNRPAGGDDTPVLITGGAGFVGSNLADHLLGLGRRVRILDNVSRPGVERNLAWLRARHGERLQLRLGDLRDSYTVEAALRGCGPVFHFAAQVAVSTSLRDPLIDFEVNARGTLNLLEALRRSPRRHGLVFTSTSKVYGRLDDIALRVRADRYEPDDPAHLHGIDESRPVSFHSAHGCSKGAAEQYVLDYARTFDLPALVLRLSCVYGPRQCGDEDQGWITHFLLRALAGRPITLHGDGRQVRDALHVDDLVDALLRAQHHVEALSAQAFNIGGGPDRTTSLLELLKLVAELRGAPPRLEFGPSRAADQRYYVSDIRRFRAATGWSPRVGLPLGLARLHRWLLENTPALHPELADSAAA
jgi:CDP-paratose 2-epimerase